MVDDAEPDGTEQDGGKQDNAEQGIAMEIEEGQGSAEQVVVAEAEEVNRIQGQDQDGAPEQDDRAGPEDDSGSVYLSQEAPISEQLPAFQNTPHSSPGPSPSPPPQVQTLLEPKGPVADTQDTQSQEEKPDPEPNPALEPDSKHQAEEELELDLTLNPDTSFTTFASCRSLNSTLNRPGHGTPPDLREHEYAFFPTGIHPRDDEAIEVLNEARRIARRLEKRLVALRNESWDDV